MPGSRREQKYTNPLPKGHGSWSRHVRWEHLTLGSAGTLPLKYCLGMNHLCQHLHTKGPTQLIFPPHQNVGALGLVGQSHPIAKLKFDSVVLQLLYLSLGFHFDVLQLLCTLAENGTMRLRLITERTNTTSEGFATLK